MNKLFTVAEIAEILRVDDGTVRRWIKEGTLQAVVLPGTPGHQAYRIKHETLNRVLFPASNHRDEAPNSVSWLRHEAKAV